MSTDHIEPGTLVELNAHDDNQVLTWDGYLQYITLFKQGSYLSSKRRDYYDEDPPLLYLGYELIPDTIHIHRKQHKFLWDDGIYILPDNLGYDKLKAVFRPATLPRQFAVHPGDPSCD